MKTMRFLIINSNRHRSPWPVPPVGACAVAAAAAAAGHEVRLLDLCFAHRPEQAVAQAVSEFRPDLVGISIRNFDNCDWHASRSFLPEIRDRIVRPAREAAGCPIVLGGGAAGLMPTEFLEYFNADYVISGDGEPAIVGLLDALAGKMPLRDVPSLTFRENGVVRVGTPARAPDLDTLPLPEPERWLDLARYASYGGPVGIQTRRGCALRCTYCAYNEIEGRCYRLKSHDRIAREIVGAVRAGVHEIEFVDSTFNVPLDHALAVCHRLETEKFPARFSTMGINPVAATEELFDALAAAGFAEIAVTAESGSAAMLASLGKGFTLDDLARTARLARRSRLPVMWYFLFGGPGETEATVRETFRFIDAHIPRRHLVLMVSGIRIVAGSPLAAQVTAVGGPSGADLLEPVFYEPLVDRRRLFELVEQRVASRPNHMGLQDVELPGALVWGASALHRLVGSKKPMWRLVAPVRRLNRALGLPSHWLARTKWPT
jgi:radical SAM superfamily enzyme YgiQ (UPF0313 family)